MLVANCLEHTASVDGLKENSIANVAASIFEEQNVNDNSTMHGIELPSGALASP